MEEDLLENVADVQLYTVRTIVISTLLCSLLAGGYMIYQNFKSLGDHKKATATVVISLITMAAVLATGFLPAFDRIPGYFYSIFLALAASLLTKKYQGDLIAEHINADGKIHSSGRAFLICIISIAVIFAFLYAAFLLQDAAINGSY